MSIILPHSMYVRSHIYQEYGSTGEGCQSCSWSAEQEKMNISQSALVFAPENLISRDGFGSPVPQ